MKNVTIFAALFALLFISPANARSHQYHRHYNHPFVGVLGAGLIQMLRASREHEKVIQGGPGVMPSYDYAPQHSSPPIKVNEQWSHRHYAPAYSHVSRFADVTGRDPRPRAWCGWQMRQWLGVADTAYNLARNWAHYGINAGGPRIGAVVVWNHHVGMITAQGVHGGWVVKSGNDGHAIRERELSLRGAIAFRLPGGHYASTY